jgi:NAD(P)-dependent dehydrogenase (short-subunit alcohol dehydrogenase family)
MHTGPTSSLKGRTYLITGGTSGIGRATALALAAHGAHVVVTGRRQPEGEAVAAEVAARGVRSLFVRGDVTDEAHHRAAVAAAQSITGNLHGAFNNAGVELAGVSVADSTPEQYRHVFDINVLGLMLSMKHQIPALLKAGGGSIVNNASVAGSVAMPGAGVYCASKHAVLGFTKAAALELAKQRVRVNAVSPGAVETPMLDRFTGNRHPDAIGFLTSMHPVGRLGRPEEIAATVLFLLSDDAAFITGADIKIDGGLTST